MKRLLILMLVMCAGFGNTAALAFDHRHSLWDQLLREHVTWINNGTASQVDYAGFQKDSAALREYLNALSSVSQAEFDRWDRNQQLAFLINAYNAFTIALILTEYPNLDSIKDLGSLFQSPWKKKFFVLLGKERNLDDIEHGLIRAPGVYGEPRIHVAVVCASVGCPALRDDAFVADNLDNQLEDSFRRFLADKTRNRYDSSSGKLEVSKIFDWYEKDFSQGYRGFDSLKTVFAKYADLLAATPADQERIREKRVDITYLDYDWSLNDRRR